MLPSGSSFPFVFGLCTKNGPTRMSFLHGRFACMAFVLFLLFPVSWICPVWRPLRGEPLSNLFSTDFVNHLCLEPLCVFFFVIVLKRSPFFLSSASGFSFDLFDFGVHLDGVEFLCPLSLFGDWSLFSLISLRAWGVNQCCGPATSFFLFGFFFLVVLRTWAGARCVLPIGMGIVFSFGLSLFSFLHPSLPSIAHGEDTLGCG